MIEWLFMPVSGELPAKTEVQKERRNISKRASGFVIEEGSRCASRLQSSEGGALMRTGAQRSRASQSYDRSDAAFFQIHLAVDSANPIEKPQRRPKFKG